MQAYGGPVRDEPLALALHNTIYAVRGTSYDGLAEQMSADAWMIAIADRLPLEARGTSVTASVLRDLRTPMREILHAAVDRTPPPPMALWALNESTAAAPHALTGVPVAGDGLQLVTTHPGSTPAQVVIAALAASGLELAGGPLRHNLRACRAPGCVLLFLKDHPRREWCSVACGNRARQARLIARRRASDAGGALS